MAASAALAQNAPAAPPAETTVEELVVVGSQIEGSKITGALPVTVVGESDITATAAVSGDELFRSIPQAGDVQFQEARTTGNLNDARGDVASINLRNLGTGNTLVLLNGRRTVLHPGTQTENFVPVQTANMNALPVSGIRRVEILRDGAAAIYGTDAVAGVINNVLDTNFKGLRAELQLGGSEGTSYQEGTFNLKAGTRTKDGTRLNLFGSYTAHSRLRASERDYAASEDHRWQAEGTPFAGDTAFDSRSTASSWGVFNTLSPATIRQGATAITNSSGQFHIEPVGNTAAGCSTAPTADGVCIRSGLQSTANDRVLRYDENPDRTLKGGVERTNLFGTLSKDLTPDLELFAEAGYYHSLFTGEREQSAILSTAPITIAANAYWNPFGPTTINGAANPNRLAGLTGVPTTGLALNLRTYRPTDAPRRTYTVTDDSVRLLGGLRGEKAGFKWETALVYSEARTKDKTHNAISNSLFQAAINRTTSDAYNPFNGGDQTNYSGRDTASGGEAAINSFLIDVYRIDKTSLAMWDFKVSKADLLRLPAGDVGMAVGTEVRRETYADDRDDRLDGTIKYTDTVTGRVYDTDVLGASPSPDVKADRTIASAYVELAVPVISPDMNIPLVRELNFQLAARDEHYSDFGNVLKPKVAGIWTVNDWLSLRGSWSQSFRAPNLPQFYSAGTTVSNSRTDYAFCRINGVACASASTIEIRSGNQGLKPEEAENTSFGLVLQPAFIPANYGRVTFTVDYWKIAETDVIGITGGANQLYLDYLYRLRGSSNPNVVRLDPAPGQTVGEVAYVSDNYQNIQPRTLEGLDVALNYEIKNTRFGSFDLKLNGARLLTFDQQPTAEVALLQEAIASGELTGITVTTAGSQIGLDGNPKWRATGTLSWRAGPWRAGLFVNYVDGVKDTGAALEDGSLFPIKSWTTASLYAQRSFDGGLLEDSSLRIGVRNVFDKDPPLATSNFGYLGALHNATGRYWYATMTKRF